MARTKLVTVTIPAGRAVGGVDLLTVPFNPQGAILFWSGRSENGVSGQGRASHRRGVGIWTPAKSRSLATTSEDALATSACRSLQEAEPTVVSLVNGSNVILGQSSPLAVVDNGDGTFSIPLSCVTAYTQAVTVTAWVIGDVGACTFVASNTSQNPMVLAVPETADALIFVGTQLNFNSSGADDPISLGIAARGGGQAVISGMGDNGHTPSRTGGAGTLSDVHLAWNNTATGLVLSSAVTNWGATEVDVTPSSPTVATLQCFGLAISGCSAAVVTVPLPAASQTEVNVSGLSFEPAGGFGIAPKTWETGRTVHLHDQTCIGAFDHDLEQAAMSTLDLSGVSPTVVATSYRPGNCFVRQSESDTPTNAAALLAKSVASDGVNFMTTMPGDGGANPAFLFVGPDTSGPQPLAPGVATLGAVTANEVKATATEATGGTAPYTHQWQRSEDDGATWGDLAGQTTLSLDDTTAVEGTPYKYRLAYTDSAAAPATVTGNTLSATPHATPTGGIILEEPMQFPLQRGVAATIPIPCFDPTTGEDLTANPLVSGDVTLAIDGADPAPLADDANAPNWVFKDGCVWVPISAGEASGTRGTLTAKDRDAALFRAPKAILDFIDYDYTKANSTNDELVADMDAKSAALAALQSGQTDVTSTLGDVQSRTALIPDAPAAVSDLPAAPDNTSIAAIKAKTDALVVAGGAVAASLSDAERTAIWRLAGAIDGVPPAVALAICAAYAAGQGVDLLTDHPAFKSLDGTKTRILGDTSDPAVRGVTLDVS